ncbi:hypothetical protein NQ176_g10579 [Zarea fungicola]|uniref:Uncharacterized protein n=1 Tax=Zarea fungicola TaxID=93591 RepID=A0ACC1MG59_9HYPO|nr:hypothetical protein NQ176_g10579 [Lecanicillium fungicola]
MEFIVGTALGVAGLLVGIKGAVDGYLLLTDIFASDTGLHFAALQYYIEGIKFLAWGERLKIGNASDCLLHRESQLTQAAVGRIIAEILTIQETAGKKFIQKYGMPDIKPESAPAAAAGTAKSSFALRSKWITHIKEERAKQKQPHRVAWQTKDKTNFTELVSRLTVLNDDLKELVRPDEFDETRVVTAILNGMDRRLSLVPIQQTDQGSPATLLALAAQLKIIQEEDVLTAAQRVNHIDASSLELFGDPKDTDGWCLGSYEAEGQVPEQILLEWKGIKANSSVKSELVTRIQALGTLLATPNAAEFHRMICLGIFDDTAYERRSNGGRRIALVYRLPKSIDTEPVSLLDLIKVARDNGTRPALGERFELAYKLTSAISLFHATNWIHKSFRSDCILFGSGRLITEPYIIGFQFSRPATGSSVETRPMGVPELDMYYHPDVSDGWTKVRELYSLGVVLLEIALWRPVFRPEFKGLRMQHMSQFIIEDVNDKLGEELVGMVGRVYLDAVKACLTGAFGVATGNTPQEAKVLGTRFFHKVVKPLSTLRA